MYTNVSEPKTAAVSSQNTALAKALSTLAAKMLSGDEAAFEAFYDTSKNYVYNNIKSLSSSLPDDTVGDIMQEVYIKIFSNISSLNSPEGTLKWLKTITVNTARDYFRKSCVRHESLMTEDEEASFENLAEKSALISPVKIPEDIAQEAETRRLVADALLSLPKQQRVLLIEFYYNESPIKDIAEMLGVSEGTAKTRLSRARSSFKNALLDTEADPYLKNWPRRCLLLPGFVGIGKRPAEKQHDSTNFVGLKEAADIYQQILARNCWYAAIAICFPTKQNKFCCILKSLHYIPTRSSRPSGHKAADPHLPPMRILGSKGNKVKVTVFRLQSWPP